MTLTLTFHPLQAMVMTYSHANVQGQRSIGFEYKVETNGRTDGRTEAIALPPSLMRSVINKYTFAEVQGQRSVDSEDKVEKDGSTDRRMDESSRLH